MTAFNTAAAYMGTRKRGGAIAPFSGLGAFGWGGAGSLDNSGGGAATRGAIVDVVIYVGDSNRVFFYDAALARSLQDRLNSSGFKVLNLDASNLGTFGGGGTIRVRVQILLDGYGSAQDAASVVSGAASGLGYNATDFSGVLVSAGTASPGVTPSTGSGQSYDPASTPGPGAGPALSSLLGGLTTNLASSPISLAVVLGAGLLLLIAVKK